MTSVQIENAIRYAFRYGKKAGFAKGGRMVIVGPFGNRTIVMFFDPATKIIESAFPK
jgi:hypothetical protein